MSTVKLTQEIMVQEILKCTQDPEYYLLNYGRIRNPKYGIMKFRLYEYQKRCLRDFQNHRFNITLKSRQTGLSTVTAGYIAWMMIFFRAKEIVVVANKQKNAQGFIRKVKTLIKKSPSWMVPRITNDNKGSIELSNGSRVEAEATTSDAARSESLDLLVIDEAAAIDTHKAGELWGAAYPTLSMGGSGIIISTPKGVGNFYHQQWVNAENGTSDFNPIYIHWTDHPEYNEDTTYHCDGCGHEYGEEKPDEGLCPICYEGKIVPTSPWYEDQCKQLGDPRLINQEINCSFLGSGDNVIDDRYIDIAEKGVTPPIRTGGFDNNLFIWKEPEPSKQYLLVADVARGDGTDFSGAHVIDLVDFEQVAEYKGKLPPDIYADFLCELGHEYNDALLAVEANSIGYATCLKVVEQEYPNIFYSTRGQFNSRDRKKLEKAYRNKANMVPGFQTTSANRPLVMSQLEECVRTNTIKINSIRTVTEFRTLIWNNGKPEAMYGYNDDLSMSLGIGILIINTTIKDILANKKLVEATLQSIKNSFSVGTDTIPQLNKSNINMRVKDNPYLMVDKRGNVEDLSWLIK